jgi:hypothetical protein
MARVAPRAPDCQGEDPPCGVPPEVLAAFFGGLRPRLRPLARGFSGAAVVLAGDPRPRSGWVLKQFPPGTTRGRAEAVHAIVVAARSAGIAAVPALGSAVAPSPPQTTVVADAAGGFWEAAGWLPGLPVTCPSIRQAEAAGRLLAAVHRAVRRCTHADHRTLAGPLRAGDRAVPPALEERLSRVRSLSDAAWSLRAGGALRRLGAFDDEAADTAALVLRTAADAERACGATRARLAAAAPPPLPVQWVLRDARSDHLLFVGDRIDGLVDWHAAGLDSPLGDLARLLGDWAVASGGCRTAHREDWWQACLDAYGGLGQADRDLIRLLHEAGLFGAMDNWFTWVIEERRRFPDWTAVARRVSAIGRCLVGLS